jgi:hypothetical protein
MIFASQTEILLRRPYSLDTNELSSTDIRKAGELTLARAHFRLR